MADERGVLQHLAMEGLAETGDVADAIGVPESAAEGILRGLASEGYVEEEGFWYVTPEGEERLNELCRARFDAGETEQLREAFGTFEELDARVKELASEWQEDREAATIRKLADLHEEVEALFDGLDPSTGREYDPYVEALSVALSRLRDGEEAYFTGTEVASYHDVWFRLHDDLLRTLGEEREEE